ncbi:GIY-YIG nuclease family protein [Streptomyces sp. NPDC086766]|uniref:GIY-YIG nuclease family protein n=1 Tax=Streptomyces sp. NPDC086766 TaxID=3365754 RepID=UPI0037F6837F
MATAAVTADSPRAKGARKLALMTCKLKVTVGVGAHRHALPRVFRSAGGPKRARVLSQWIAENARVCWIEHAEPWTMESEPISQLDLPLNLDQNRHNPFHGRLTELRSQARQRASELAVSA